jgi:DNA helicase-2/ATP-dependent DNA helicase PcrA
LDDPDTAGARNENVAELVNAAAGFHESSGGGSLDRFLEQVALVADPDTIVNGEGVVRLMTIHTAKGLEFPVVVITGCEDDILPHINSAEDEHGLEEERRLFYVAMTRAQKRVYLLHAARRRRFGVWQESLPSRFLAEIPDDLIERRHLDSGDRIQAPVARTLFGETGGTVGGSGAWSRRPGSSRSHSASRPVRPEEWGRRSGGKQSGSRTVASAGGGWDDEIVQAAPFYEGQTVSHGIFGSGVVDRVEGRGDFHEAGRKHINPRFAPLVPVD